MPQFIKFIRSVNQTGTVMDKKIFNKIREIVYEKSGISLNEGKEALVSARVGKRMRQLDISEYRDYLSYLEKDTTGQEYVFMIDAISTNVTSFFREGSHFEFLSKILQEWFEKGQTRLRVWSCASSTGEEPYSIAMTVYDLIQEYGVDTKILATDISTKVLSKCMEGIYKEDKLESVNLRMRDRFFEKYTDEGGEKLYKVRDNLKKLITFTRINLSKPPFPMQGPFDVVFCRNVMIYFDNIVRKKLLTDIIRLLRPGGYLMVGHAESLTGIMISGIKGVMPAVYMKC